MIFLVLGKFVEFVCWDFEMVYFGFKKGDNGVSLEWWFFMYVVLGWNGVV